MRKPNRLVLGVSRTPPKRDGGAQSYRESEVSFRVCSQPCWQSYYHGTADMKPTAVFAAVGFVVPSLSVQYRYERKRGD